MYGGTGQHRADDDQNSADPTRRGDLFVQNRLA
jgi:hypothetical protein